MRAKRLSPKRAKTINNVKISPRTEEGPSSEANGNTQSPAANRKKSLKGQHKNDDFAVKMTVRPVSTNSNHREKGNRTLSTRHRRSQSHTRQTTAGPRSSRQRRVHCLETVRRRKTIKSKMIWNLRQWRQFSRTAKISINHPSKPNLQNDQAQLKQQILSKMDANVVGTARSLTRLVRSLQLCSSSSESSPSPPASPTRIRRTVRGHRTRSYGNQLKWYQALRTVKKYQQSTHKLDQTSPGSSGVKGLTDNRMKRKSCLPAAQSPPATKRLLRKNSRRLWRRQLDSSGSDSPVSECSVNSTPVWSCSRPSSRLGTHICLPSDTLTSLEAASASVLEGAQVVMPPVTNQDKNEGSPHTLGQALCDRNRVAFTHLKEQQNMAEPKCTLTDLNFLDINSSESSECPQNESRLPSSLHVCKFKKKLEKYSSSAVIKHKMQFKTPNELEVNGKHQSDNSQVITKVLGPCPHCEMSTSLSPAMREIWSPADSSMGTKHAHTYNPSQMETRSEAQSQARGMAPLFKRSEKCPASKTSLIYFKHPTSTSSKTITTGDDCTSSTPFRKPDTPRPKVDSESLKCKKVLEQRTESTYLGAEIKSGQGQSSKKSSLQPSSVPSNAELPSPVFKKLAALSPEQGKFNPELLHPSRVALSYESLHNVEQRCNGRGEITEGQNPAAASLSPNTATLNGIGAAVHREMVEQRLSTSHPSPNLEVTRKQSAKASSSELIHTIFGSMSFVAGVQPVEAEPGSVSVASHTTPSHDSPALIRAGAMVQTSSQRALSGCQFYAVNAEPLEPDHPPIGQNASPSWPMQGAGGDTHIQSITQP